MVVKVTKKVLKGVVILWKLRDLESFFCLFFCSYVIFYVVSCMLCFLAALFSDWSDKFAKASCICLRMFLLVCS